MPTISAFINDLKLDKADQSTLIQHIQECHANAGVLAFRTGAQTESGEARDFVSQAAGTVTVRFVGTLTRKCLRHVTHAHL